MVTFVLPLMYSGKVLYDLDKILYCCVTLHAAPVGDLETLDHLGHLIVTQVQKRFDEVAINKTL